MRQQWIVLGGVLTWSACAMVACSSSNGNGGAPGDDAGGTDSSVVGDAQPAETGAPVDAAMGAPADSPTDAPLDAEIDAPADGPTNGQGDAQADAPIDGQASPDGGFEASADGAPAPARLLLSYNGGTTSELSAFGLASNAVDGRFIYPGFIGTTFVTPASPWLLEQANDVVGRLDPIRPWVVDSSWNVALNDLTDAGYTAPYSDPDGVVVGAGTKAYILRYTRNLIAVVDTSQNVDGGAPLKTIDLSSQVQAGGDGYVEMTAGWYDSNNSRVYVLLGNIDRFDVGCGGYCQLCSDTSPTIVAIDTTTDTLVPLGGDAGGDAAPTTSGYVLQGYDPAFGPSPMVYDAPNNRLLVLESGCNVSEADGGVGPLVHRGVEAVSLATGSTQQLLDLTSAPFPQAIYYVDSQHVILLLDTAYAWDPSSTTLGPAIPNAPDVFDVDPQGNLVGVTQDYAADGGAAGVRVVSVSSGDGGVTTLGQNPFSLTNGYFGGAQLWPPR
jgi:hypothetical protein